VVGDQPVDDRYVDRQTLAAHGSTEYDAPIDEEHGESTDSPRPDEGVDDVLARLGVVGIWRNRDSQQQDVAFETESLKPHQQTFAADGVDAPSTEQGDDS